MQLKLKAIKAPTVSAIPFAELLRKSGEKIKENSITRPWFDFFEFVQPQPSAKFRLISSLFVKTFPHVRFNLTEEKFYEFVWRCHFVTDYGLSGETAKLTLEDNKNYLIRVSVDLRNKLTNDLAYDAAILFEYIAEAFEDFVFGNETNRFNWQLVFWLMGFDPIAHIKKKKESEATLIASLGKETSAAEIEDENDE